MSDEVFGFDAASVLALRRDHLALQHEVNNLRAMLEARADAEGESIVFYHDPKIYREDGQTASLTVSNKYPSGSGSVGRGGLSFKKMYGDHRAIGLQIHALTAFDAPLFTVKRAGLYVFTLTLEAVVTWSKSADGSAFNPFHSETLTTSAASAGTAHTHTVDVKQYDTDQSRSAMLQAEIGRRIYGNTSWQTSTFGQARLFAALHSGQSSSDGFSSTASRSVFRCNVGDQFRIRLLPHSTFSDTKATSIIQPGTCLTIKRYPISRDSIDPSTLAVDVETSGS